VHSIVDVRFSNSHAPLLHAWVLVQVPKPYLELTRNPLLTKWRAVQGLHELKSNVNNISRSRGVVKIGTLTYVNGFHGRFSCADG